MTPDVVINQPAVFRLAYLARAAFEDEKAYRGGVLVVDQRGTPVEFRCTSPVRPNAVQRITYGDSLDPYMLIELMAKPLLRSLREPINLLIVNDSLLLNVREHIEQPVVFIRRQGADMSQRGDGEEPASALLDSPTGHFDPVVLQSFRDRARDLELAYRLLQESAKSLDVLEPFQRVERALQKVHEEKTLDRT